MRASNPRTRESPSSNGAPQSNLATSTVLRPLFRWPGGKRWLIDTLVRTSPAEYGRYYEPFVGAGALYFALQPGSATLGDANSGLIEAYQVLRDDPTGLSKAIRRCPGGAEGYYKVRASRPRTATTRAARFLFLAQHAFNGIYRVNRAGEFNVPYGGREYPTFGDALQLKARSEVLGSASLVAGDFERSLDGIKPGDFAYLDPPYSVAHENNGFLKYNEQIFLWRDMERLARIARELANSGVYLLVSNARHAETAKLFSFLEAIQVSRPSTISADLKGRGVRNEYLFTNISRREESGL